MGQLHADGVSKVNQKKAFSPMQAGLGFKLEVAIGRLSMRNDVDVSEHGGGEVSLNFQEAVCLHAVLGRLIADQEIWRYDIDENDEAICCVDDA